jgi:hypothetical protein
MINEPETKTESMNMFSVFIEGNKDDFKSKSAVVKFKEALKLNPNPNISSFSSLYLKDDTVFELVEKTDKFIKVKLTKKQKNKSDTQSILKNKLKAMHNERTNTDYHKAKNAGNVPSDILTEYLKLKKIMKIPLLEPSTVLSKKEEHKPIISMMLSNPMLKSLGTTHPYVKYIKMLAKEVGLNTELNTELHNDLQFENIVKMTNGKEISNVQSNISLAADGANDTEDEDED